MYEVSTQFQTKINEAVRETRLRGTITVGGSTVVLSGEDILTGSVVLSNQCVDGNDFSIGSVHSGMLKFSIFDYVTSLDLTGKEVSLEFGLVIAPGTVEYVPLGVFTVIEAVHKLTAITLTCLDNMIKLDQKITTELSGTPDQLLAAITSATGVQVKNTSVATFANGNDSIIVILCDSLQTYRDLLMWLCEYMACIALMSRDGKIWLRRVLEPTVGQLPQLVRFKAPNVHEENVNVTSITAKLASSLYVHNLALTLNDGKGMVYKDNPLLWALDDVQASLRIENILVEMNTAQYVPAEVEYNGNPALDLGDYIWLLDTVRGDVLIRITSISWKSKGKSKLKAAGLSSLLVSKNDLSSRLNETRTDALVDKLSNEIILIASDVAEVESQVNGTDGLEARVNAAELKITPQAITQTVEDTSTLLAKKTYVDQTASSYVITAKAEIRNEYGETISNIQQNFQFDVNGLEIGLEGSEFSTLYTNAMMAFLQNGTIVQYLSGNKNYITNLVITGNMAMPNHKFETLANGHTVVRYIGA